jgi:hypothetical protein
MHYRLYLLDAANHIQRAVDLECEDDTHAILEGGAHSHARGKELWQGARMVMTSAPAALRAA